MIFFNLFCVLEDRQQSRTQVQSRIKKNLHWRSTSGQKHKSFAETNQENIKIENSHHLKNIKTDKKKGPIYAYNLKVNLTYKLDLILKQWW